MDGASLGARLDRAASEKGRVLPVLVQVDLAGEATKFGLEETSLLATLESLRALSSLRVEGLMVLPPYFDDPEATRPSSSGCAPSAIRPSAAASAGAELSMGMSHDFEVAIEEGATLVRVGTALFGSEAA